ncbi:very long chain fatty acid elongase 4-like [Lycorma delicatula]|uniref:very long chain fatty acid elongase 4-like n=1 Tax=Lycorma delicatula TaxID=130591 RepID=UPI003F518332
MDMLKLRFSTNTVPINVTSKDGFLEEEKLINSWFLMGSPGPMLTIIVTYLVFVLHLGPRIMWSKKPFELRSIMLLYNLLQIILNIFVVMTFFFNTEGIKYLFNHSCQPADSKTNFLRIDMCVGYWRYTMLKFLDLIDTVFFILRKKNSHVTFLHVYHHCGMALFSWCCLKYFRGEQGVLLGVMNCAVHVIMYTYYFLAGFGEEVRRHLWWKKYITRIQMGQFCVGICYILSLIFFGCNLPKGFSLFWVANMGIFLILFYNFYTRTYTKAKLKN